MIAVEQGWQPIASAPNRDGAMIIGHDPKWGVAQMMLDGAKSWILAAFNGAMIEVYPTHWMPLPSPPEPGK